MSPIAEPPVADILLRIVERRRQCLAEAEGDGPVIIPDVDADVLTPATSPP